MTRANSQVSYVGGDGRFNIEGLKLLHDLDTKVTALEAQLAAIAAVTAPTGGATNDAEARAAVVAIIGAAG